MVEVSLKFLDVEMINVEKNKRSYIYIMNCPDLPRNWQLGCECANINVLAEQPGGVYLGIDPSSGAKNSRIDAEDDSQNPLSLLGI